MFQKFQIGILATQHNPPTPAGDVLEEKKEMSLTHTPRSYQLEFLRKAQQENVIIVAETGQKKSSTC